MAPSTARAARVTLLVLPWLAAACSVPAPPPTTDPAPATPPAAQSPDAERRQWTADVTLRLLRRLDDAATAASKVEAPRQTGIDPTTWSNAYQLGFLYGVLGLHFSDRASPPADDKEGRSFAAGWEKGQRDGTKENGLLLESFCGRAW